ncbi:hypothetical protein HanLR1_Chr10g0369471 [Helianthus annuus]|nr:hypothetical protein HanHA89_Chr10g0392061 [Helianthus annuus]KAJ0697489.1 hypothetical protein HanLR1_Chr10g0369471 [Helianthus annuus]
MIGIIYATIGSQKKPGLKYSDQMELNRRNQVNISRGLSVDSQSCIQNCKFTLFNQILRAQYLQMMLVKMMV